MWWIVGAVALAAFAGLVMWADRRRQDEALDLALKQTYLEAKAVLSPDDLLRLREQIAKLDEETTAAQARIGARPAVRLGKLAAIRTIHAFLEIDQMFPGPRDSAV